jgi:hypothetical protein
VHFQTNASYFRLDEIQTHRRLHIPKQSPVRFDKPFVLLDLAGSTLAAHSRPFIFVQQPDDEIFPGTANQTMIS